MNEIWGFQEWELLFEMKPQSVFSCVYISMQNERIYYVERECVMCVFFYPFNGRAFVWCSLRHSNAQLYFIDFSILCIPNSNNTSFTLLCMKTRLVLWQQFLNFQQFLLDSQSLGFYQTLDNKTKQTILYNNNQNPMDFSTLLLFTLHCTGVKFNTNANERTIPKVKVMDKSIT